MLSGAEIKNLCKTSLLSPRVKNPSHKFVAALEHFLEDICQQVTHLQSKFTEEKFLKNFTFLTQEEFNEFIKLVWENYEKAIM